jgi:SAM-dependent methyltransferase
VAILWSHIQFFREAFGVPGLLSEPLLMLGVQKIRGANLPPDFAYRSLHEMLADRGLGDVKAVDLFDARADLRYDLNLPVPEEEHERYATVLDIGTLEHLFDARQCLESCLRMVRPGGHYMVVTPVNGHLRHGFHTFHPDFVRQALEINGFEIRHWRYASSEGEPLRRPEDAPNSMVWAVGEKVAPLDEFRIPQQRLWRGMYEQDG